MKEDVVAANLANLRQSINELKECIEKQNTTVPKPEQSVKVDFDEKTIYDGIAKSFCSCWNDALSVVKKHIWKQQPDTLPFSLWFPKLIELFKQKSKFLEYLYRHVCDYNLNRMTIEANTDCILKRQDEILVRINELKSPVTIIPPNINGMFIRGHHIKLRYSRSSSIKKLWLLDKSIRPTDIPSGKTISFRSKSKLQPGFFNEKAYHKESFTLNSPIISFSLKL